MTRKDGGPAFPLPLTADTEGVLHDTEDYCESNRGMSLRDWFAGHAMHALLSSVDLSTDDSRVKVREVIRHAFMVANAMVEVSDSSAEMEVD